MFIPPKFLLSALVGAVCTLLAWWFPGQGIGAVYGWLALFCFCWSIYTQPSYFAYYLAGLFINLFGFFWLSNTISHFGGFGPLATLLIFSGYVLSAGLQFLAVVFLFKYLPPVLECYALRFSFAWLCTEVLFIRIFPWEISHTQLGFLPLAQLADLGGAPLISLLMLFGVEAMTLVWMGKLRVFKLAFPLVLLVLGCVYGHSRISFFRENSSPMQEVALVQGNVSLEQKHSAESFAQNLKTYLDASEKVLKEDLLLIWPESAFPYWVPVEIGHARVDPRIPSFKSGVHFLTGALTYRSPEEIYNSALAIYADGVIPEPSHKQILVPFGEYMPFGKILPWLRQFSPSAADFSAGSEYRIFRYPKSNGTYLELAALICYEDIIPEPARDVSRRGAQLLVNLTNDAWFGDSFAPWHHNLMASFRAIENRRYLLRATNTGLTTIIAPDGRTVQKLSLFQPGVLSASVQLLDTQTFYTRYLGSKPWVYLSLICVLVCLLRVVTEYRR